jgi:putative membrane protein
MSASTPQLDTGTRLAVDRTRLAHERTMMAWIRTATSLISFGFAIYKFFHLDLRGPEGTLTARGFAIMLISMGIVALVLAGLQHHASLRTMRVSYGALPRSVAGPVAVLIGLLGVVALIGVIVRA